MVILTFQIQKVNKPRGKANRVRVRVKSKSKNKRKSKSKNKSERSKSKSGSFVLGIFDSGYPRNESLTCAFGFGRPLSFFSFGYLI